MILESSDFSECCGKEKIILPLAGIATHDRPARTTVAIPTTLSTLLVVLVRIKLISPLVINRLMTYFLILRIENNGNLYSGP
jgi:hypothetical protein